jgi:hypothetical protein
MIKHSHVITVLFDTKNKTFLGRRAKWVSAEEFVRNPPANGRDVSTEPEKPKDGGKRDPGGFFECVDGTLYWCQENLGTGGFDRYDCGPCPW